MNTMKYTVTPESPVDIEISANGETHHISFYPTDLAVRERFYQTYENLKNYKHRGFKVDVDKNGVSNAELENAKELRRFAEFLGEQVDGIYGEGTAKILTGGRCEPSELIRFICETAKYFTQTSDQLIRHYTEAVQGGVMK